jgi:hypothetical protein
MFAEVVTRSYFIDFSAWPRWLVVLEGGVVAAVLRGADRRMLLVNVAAVQVAMP